jgi:uncharacterized protein YlxW (UPF0749 family)
VATGTAEVKQPGSPQTRKGWATCLALAAFGIALGLLLVAQLRTQVAVREAVSRQDWAFAVADLVDSNARLREEIALLQAELDQFPEGSEGRTSEGIRGAAPTTEGNPVLQSLVDEVNYLRIVNGLVAVSGPGIEVQVSGPVSVVDLYDLTNELRNAGAEALALNGLRLAAWSALTSDGQSVIVDGVAIPSPYYLQAIGEVNTLEAALLRPGGLVDLLNQVGKAISITVVRHDRLTLPIYDQPVQWHYARPLE